MSTIILSAFALVFQEAATGRLSLMAHSARNPDLSKFLTIGALLFIIGVAGVLTRRNIIVIFFSINLILNGKNLNLSAFSLSLKETGNVNAGGEQFFGFFVIVEA